MRQAGAWIGFVIGAAALILQLSLTIPLRLADGDTLPAALVFYLSSFTILANLALVLIYASELWATPILGWFRAPVTHGMMAAALALVAIFSHVLLAETWEPEGLGLVCDGALRYVTPALYILWWIATARHGKLGWSDVWSMLLPPTIYLVYVMARGALTGDYPYPILEADRLSYAEVALDALAVLLGLAALSTIVVGLDRLLGAPRP